MITAISDKMYNSKGTCMGKVVSLRFTESHFLCIYSVQINSTLKYKCYCFVLVLKLESTVMKVLRSIYFAAVSVFTDVDVVFQISHI